MSIKKVSSLYLPSIEEIQAAPTGSLMYFDNTGFMEFSQNVMVKKGDASQFQLTASDAFYITSSADYSTEGHNSFFVNTLANLTFSSEINTMENLDNSSGKATIDITDDIIGYDTAEISGSWIYFDTPQVGHRIIQDDTSSPSGLNIQVKSYDNGEQYYEISADDSFFAEDTSSSGHEILYIDDSWDNGGTDLGNNEHRAIYLHKNTRFVIFDTTQDLFYHETTETYNSVTAQARHIPVYLPQSAESANFYGYTAPTSESDWLSYDNSSIEFVFKRLKVSTTNTTEKYFSDWKFAFYCDGNKDIRLPFINHSINPYSSKNYQYPIQNNQKYTTAFNSTARPGEIDGKSAHLFVGRSLFHNAKPTNTSDIDQQDSTTGKINKLFYKSTDNEKDRYPTVREWLHEARDSISKYWSAYRKTVTYYPANFGYPKYIWHTNPIHMWVNIYGIRVYYNAPGNPYRDSIDYTKRGIDTSTSFKMIFRYTVSGNSFHTYNLE